MANLPQTKGQVQQFIATIEDQLSKLPQVEAPLRHFFSHDCYGREVTLPANCYFIGKIHKFRVLNIVTQGRLSVMSPDMDGIVELKAGDIFVSEPGAKRLVFTHEESKWMNVHGTTETDVEKIEAMYIAKNYDEVVGLPEKEAKCLMSP